MVGNVEAILTFLESRDQSWKGFLLLWLWVSSYLLSVDVSGVRIMVLDLVPHCLE